MNNPAPVIPDAAALARHFNMQPHPEGGYFVETYRSTGLIPAQALPEKFGAQRVYSTTILYLLEGGDKSCLHRIRQDEGWHFYLGGPLRLVIISPAGDLQEIRLGQDILAGEQVQYTVPAGYWFGATPLPGAAYSFVGCTVAPGFEFADFELGKTDELTELFPHLQDVIRRFAQMCL